MSITFANGITLSLDTLMACKPPEISPQAWRQWLEDRAEPTARQLLNFAMFGIAKKHAPAFETVGEIHSTASEAVASAKIEIGNRRFVIQIHAVSI